jgi:DNA-binding beta-propeller fold protein YncE
LARLGAGGALAGLALGPDATVGAVCRRPKKACAKGKQCCSGKCKKGRCGRCPAGTAYVFGSQPACWPWLTWGAFGSGDGQFNNPTDMAVGGSGRVYVTDQIKHHIQEFDATGGFVRKWGSLGRGDGQVNSPVGVAVSGSGQVYVADSFNDRIQEFDATGNFVLLWGSEGIGDGQFSSPRGVAVDGTGQVYVADLGNHRIVRVTPL